MPEAKTVSAAKAPIEKISLVKPHTHAGRDYAPGAELILADVGMNQDDATWLIAAEVAKDASNA